VKKAVGNIIPAAPFYIVGKKLKRFIWDDVSYCLLHCLNRKWVGDNEQMENEGRHSDILTG
jgi:hypothetical protein